MKQGIFAAFMAVSLILPGDAVATTDIRTTASICDAAAVRASDRTGVPVEALRALALLDHDAGQLPAFALRCGADRPPLRLEAEARPGLLVGADPDVSDHLHDAQPTATEHLRY